MQTSNVLVVGPSRLGNGKDFGAHFVNTFAEARAYLLKHNPGVLVFGHTRNGEFQAFCDYALQHAKDSRWIVVASGLSPSLLIELNNSGQLHDLIDDFEDPELEDKLRQALEARGEAKQRAKLIELFEDQSLTLHRLSGELEARVQKRHKALRKTLKTLDETKTRMEAFHSALLGIHRASTVLQMEQSLNEALKGTIDIEWVRVRFAAQSSLPRQSGANILAIELPYQFDLIHGEVLFAKAEGKRFSADEKDFLAEMSEALALSVSRLQKLEQAETLKGQWQATFDAIPHPLCLVSTQTEILKLNRAFFEKVPTQFAGPFRSLLGKPCFKTFFGDEFSPPAEFSTPNVSGGAHLTSVTPTGLHQAYTFRQMRNLARDPEYYEITGQLLGLTHEDQNVHLVMMRPVTEEVRFERRILEASKLAELGTIGSSIAHELNNPLGGMLSFLQLILMDLQKADPLFIDIKAMEEAVFRCRDIVLNLLSFARKQDLGDFTKITISDVVEKAIKLIELQSKSQGIEIHFQKPKQSVFMQASTNAMTQALCNLLQNSIDAIAVRHSQESLEFQGEIKIELEALDTHSCRLNIRDNGTGIKPEVHTQIFNPLFTTRDPKLFSGMGLTTAFTILTEHHGHLEILSQTGSGTTAILTLPRLDESPD